MSVPFPLRRGPRGAAAVEMAVCMLVIIPVFLYALFLDDLLRYSLDAQEAALSTVWDFTVQDYTRPLATAASKSEPPGGRTQVQKQARLMFCDHESGVDSFQTRDYGGTANYPDCEEETHHVALAAHVCWINAQARQVTCEEPVKEVGALGGPGPHGAYHQQFTNGGLILCSAQAIVENHLLPTQFLPEFSEVGLINHQWSENSAHENSKQGTKDTAYILNRQQLAILTDTWALTAPARVAPGQKSGDVYARVAAVYQHPLSGFPVMSASASQFFHAARSEGLLNPAFVAPLVSPGKNNPELGGLDDPRKPNISLSPHLASMAAPSQKLKQERNDVSYFNTEWRDWERDGNRRTYEKRGPWYLGCKRAGGC